MRNLFKLWVVLIGIIFSVSLIKISYAEFEPYNDGSNKSIPVYNNSQWVKPSELSGNVTLDVKIKNLKQQLNTTNRFGKILAVQELGAINDSRAVEPLIEALGDEDWRVKAETAKVLGNIGDSRAVEPLIELFEYKDWLVKVEVVKALGNIGDSRAVDSLIEALGDGSYMVRKEASEALGKIQDPLGINTLEGQDINDTIYQPIEEGSESINNSLFLIDSSEKKVITEQQTRSARYYFNELLRLLHIIK